MKQNVILPLFFAVGIGGGLILRLWATGNSARIIGPNQLQVLDDGTVIAAAGRHFYVHNSAGELQKKVPAAQLGSEFYVGSFWATDADTLIMRNDRLMNDSLSTGLRAFARQREPSLFDQSYTGPSILQRCELSSGTCTSLGNGGQAFHTRRIFGLTMDPSGKRIVVADTTSWELLELDATGTMTRRSAASFKFPNEVQWSANGLWVADTNNHRLAKVDVSHNKFGEVLESIPIERNPGDDFIWPVAFTHGATDRWFVINLNTAFDASRVDVLDGKGKRLKSVSLPRGADCLDIANDGERVLVADFRGFAIHAVDLNGDKVTSFGSSEFKQDMAALAEARAGYRLLGQLGFVLMGAVLVVLFIFQRKAGLRA